MRHFCYIVIAVLLFLRLALVAADDFFKSASSVAQNDAERTSEINALNNLLFELALERHSQFSNEVVVFAVHRGQKVRKFSDGKISVISLPLPPGRDSIALCRYVAQCNVLTLSQIDARLASEKYDELKKQYEVLKYFDRCESLKKDIGERLALLAEIAKGNSIAENHKKLEGLRITFGSAMHLAETGTISTTMVTNLLEVKLP